MDDPELRQRKLSIDQTTELQRSKESEPRLKHGLTMQIVRSLLMAAWFNCCCMVLFVTQIIGAPLYFISKDYYYSYMAHTKQCFCLVITVLTEWSCPTYIRVSGDEDMRGQIQLTEDGQLKTQFPERLVVLSNHQVYTDWIYLWWIAYTNTMHGRIFIILKESLKYIPILGVGMQFYGFIFMARKWLSDKPRLQYRLEKLKTQHAGSHSEAPAFDPMWLLMFPEGTNLSINTKRRSDEYGRKQGIPSMKHAVIPRSTGLFFCLQQLKGTIDWVYDCTVAYEGPPKGSYPDKFFTLRSTYLQGRSPKSVNMYWRQFAMSDIPLEDPKEFDAWLRERWMEKDQLLEHCFETGRFPTGLAGSIEAGNVTAKQMVAASSGYAEAPVRLGHWLEVGQIFAVLLGVALLCRILGLLGIWQ